MTSPLRALLCAVVVSCVTFGCGKSEAPKPIKSGGTKGKPAPASSDASTPKTPVTTPATAVSVPKVADLKVHDLASLKAHVKAQKGKATVVAVWATWCAPCIAEMPTLAAFYEKHKDKGLRVVGLCVDDRAEDGMGEKIQQVLEKVKVPFEMALLKPETDEAFFKGLGVEWDSGLPATVVFGPTGEKKLYTRKALTHEYLDQHVLPLVN